MHLCCCRDTVSKEFFNLINSFDLRQWVNGPNHRLGHMLDLVLYYNLPIHDINVNEVTFSDHKSVFWIEKAHTANRFEELSTSSDK